MHAKVISGQIESIGGLPASARRLDTQDWVMGLATAPAALVKACGYLPIVEQRAALGANQQHGEPAYTVRTDDVLATYSAVALSADAIEQRATEASLRQSYGTIRTWADDCAVVAAQGANVSQVQLKTMFDRLGKFLDGFADLLRADGRHQ